MHWFLLAALALAAAVVLWYMQAAPGSREAAVQPPAAAEGEAFRRWLDTPGILEGLERAVDALGELMAHRSLGGPGFLTVRLPQSGADGGVAVTAQYPNIREAMYRLVVRRELDRETLWKAGTPERLLALSPEFETESGGVVVVSVQTAAMEPGLANRLSDRRERQAALRLLAERLGRRFPGFEVRPFGAELLLTPVREGAAV